MHRTRLKGTRTRLKGTRTTRRPGLRTALALFTGLMLTVGAPATVAGAHPGHDGCRAGDPSGGG